jgi:hypothetical protein
MIRTRSVFCPLCTKKLTLDWNNAIGIYRGFCRRCQNVIYLRENGRPWVRRDDQKWLAVAEDLEQSHIDIHQKLHLLITGMKKEEILELLRQIWDDMKGLFR